MLSFGEARKFFPITESHIYLAIAATNPGASPVVSAIHHFYDDLQSGRGSMDIWHAKVSETKENIAKLIHCDPDEICLVKNTSEGLNIAAEGIPLQPGDQVIVNDLENPNNIYNWLNLERKKGVKIKIVRSRDCRLDLDDIVMAIKDRTRVLSLSHVTPYYGFRSNLAELGKICRARGIYLVVDGIQAVGVIDVDAKNSGVDILACGGHKGLLGTFGTGFLYLNKDTCSEISPVYMARASVDSGSEFPYNGVPYKDARRFDIGNQNYPGIYGLNEGVKLILSLGIKNIEKKVMTLTGFLIHRLRSENFEINSSLVNEERAGIISFNISDPMRVHQQLREKNIVVSVRRSSIRVSPHLYNTEEEIGEFMDHITRIRKGIRV